MNLAKKLSIGLFKLIREFFQFDIVTELLRKRDPV